MTALPCLLVKNEILKLALVAFCLLVGVVLNGDLAARCGKTHYQMLLSGNIRRNNNIDTLNNTDRKSYKREMEYRPYKGFLIGLCVCVPVILILVLYAVFGLNSEATTGGSYYARLAILLLAGWAILPWELLSVVSTPFIALFSCALPILVTGILYLIGAKKEENTVREREERMEAAKNAAKESNRQRKKRERESRNF